MPVPLGTIRVILVGPAAQRQRLQVRLPDTLEVVGEASTMTAARKLGRDPDAYLLTPERGTGIFPREESKDACPPLIEPLTPREMEVLTLLADGLPNKAIAARLGISDETIKFHLASVFGKLGASNRTDAVRQALRRGLVPL